MIKGKKIAIFGGTFNPPHIGHRKMAEMLCECEAFDKIHILPDCKPPHKTGDFAPGEDRLNMCRLAFGDLPKVEISDFELKLGGKSYTVRTLEELKKQGIEYPGFVIGADSLVNFQKWYRYEDVLKLAELIVYKRGGLSDEKMLSAKADLEKKGGKITLLDFCPPDISSTEIRKNIEEGKSVEGLVANEVEEYIKKKGFYLGDAFMEPVFSGKCVNYREKYDKYVLALKDCLTEKRFFHTLAVAKEAVRLAEKYGGDTEKAFLAGLLHDICKDTDPKQQLQLFSQFDIILDDIEKNAPKLWHAKLGAAYIQNVLGIDDEEIITAVRYHTTARADMSLLEKLIYLADFTSEDRNYNGVEDMRVAVDKSLEQAMYEALEFSVEDLKEKGTPIHKDTMDAYIQIKNAVKGS